jgi:hypothetical protein
MASSDEILLSALIEKSFLYQVLLYAIQSSGFSVATDCLQEFYDISTYTRQVDSISEHRLLKSSEKLIGRLVVVKLVIDVAVSCPHNYKLACAVLLFLQDVCEDNNFENSAKLLNEIGLVPFFVLLSAWALGKSDDLLSNTSTAFSTASAGSGGSAGSGAVSVRDTPADHWYETETDGSNVSPKLDSALTIGDSLHLQLSASKLLRQLVAGGGHVSASKLSAQSAQSAQATALPSGCNGTHTFMIISFASSIIRYACLLFLLLFSELE